MPKTTLKNWAGEKTRNGCGHHALEARNLSATATNIDATSGPAAPPGSHCLPVPAKWNFHREPTHFLPCLVLNTSPKDKSCWQSRSGTHFWAYLSELRFSLLPRPTSKVWLPVLRTKSSPDEWQMPSSIWVDYLEDDGQPKVQLSTIHLSKVHWESWGSAGPIMA